jgi:hypothetical protein
MAGSRPTPTDRVRVPEFGTALGTLRRRCVGVICPVYLTTSQSSLSGTPITVFVGKRSACTHRVENCSEEEKNGISYSNA